MRKYKSGSTWALWRWTHTPSGYITRLHVLKTPWFAVCLHWLNGPDPEPHLHDHPVSFLSIILRGGYEETRVTKGGPWQAYKRRWFNWVRATPDDRHSIYHVEPKTLTLALMGPKVREWGFHTEDGWIHYKQYNKEKYAG